MGVHPIGDGAAAVLALMRGMRAPCVTAALRPRTEQATQHSPWTRTAPTTPTFGNPNGWHRLLRARCPWWLAVLSRYLVRIASQAPTEQHACPVLEAVVACIALRVEMAGSVVEKLPRMAICPNPCPVDW